MISFVLRVIPRLVDMAFPVLLRLALFIVVFRVARFLWKEWKGLGKV